jgi:hypothetical protein
MGRALRRTGRLARPGPARPATARRVAGAHREVTGPVLPGLARVRRPPRQVGPGPAPDLGPPPPVRRVHPVMARDLVQARARRLPVTIRIPLKRTMRVHRRLVPASPSHRVAVLPVPAAVPVPVARALPAPVVAPARGPRQARCHPGRAARGRVPARCRPGRAAPAGLVPARTCSRPAPVAARAPVAAVVAVERGRGLGAAGAPGVPAVPVAASAGAVVAGVVAAVAVPGPGQGPAVPPEPVAQAVLPPAGVVAAGRPPGRSAPVAGAGRAASASRSARSGRSGRAVSKPRVWGR